MESQRIRYTKEQLDDALTKGIISKDTYDSNIDAAISFDERRSTLERMMSDGDYVFDRSMDDLKTDLGFGLIDDRTYDAIAFLKNMGYKHPKNDIISVKLRFNLMGLKDGGRYDTFEYILDPDDHQISERRYCIHGTLFEGCGNYKAPDSAHITGISKDRSDRIINFISQLCDDGSLEKDYTSAEGFDSIFFDLYVRTENGTIHTKGTERFPPFLDSLILMFNASIWHSHILLSQ